MHTVARHMRYTLLLFLVVSAGAFVVSDQLLIGTAQSRVSAIYDLNEARNSALRLMYLTRDVLLNSNDGKTPIPPWELKVVLTE